eukprot:6209336-Pleurochrysis_carterae.AAC.1
MVGGTYRPALLAWCSMMWRAMAARHLPWVLLWAFAGASDPPASLYDIEVEDLKSGLPVSLDFYRGKVLLVVNVASQCGYTDSTYSMLNTLHDDYSAKGLAVLGFPCNQFGNQEPGDARSIFDFAAGKKGAKFDLFRKVDVNGPEAHPLFKYLRGDFIPTDCLDTDANCAAWAANGECTNNPGFMGSTCRRACKLCDPPKGSGPPIRWNFESFLISRSGEVHRRWATGTTLTNSESRREIESLLSAKDEM